MLEWVAVNMMTEILIIHAVLVDPGDRGRIRFKLALRDVRLNGEVADAPLSNIWALLVLDEVRGTLASYVMPLVSSVRYTSADIVVSVLSLANGFGSMPAMTDTHTIATTTTTAMMAMSTMPIPFLSDLKILVS